MNSTTDIGIELKYTPVFATNIFCCLKQEGALLNSMSKSHLHWELSFMAASPSELKSSQFRWCLIGSTAHRFLPQHLAAISRRLLPGPTYLNNMQLTSLSRMLLLFGYQAVEEDSSAFQNTKSTLLKNLPVPFGSFRIRCEKLREKP